VAGEINLAVSRLGLEKQVRLLGAPSDDEVIKLYHACDVVVLPALDMMDDVEGFGIVALEAAAAGKPVVATRVGGIPDAVEDGKSGLLIDADDYKELSRSIMDLVADEKKRWGMGEYARSRVGEKFSWEKILERYESVLSESSRANDQTMNL
jgi:glycosyltransferase involved in cell wall biosynthesis